MSRRVADAFSRQAVVVVGIGADGWPGLAEEARDALRSAGTVVASPRQLEQLPTWLTVRRVEWRSPRRGDIRALIEEHATAGLIVLASGDPLVHGIGRTLVEELGADRLLFLPAVSSVALARARLGWPAEEVTVLNAAGGRLESLTDHVGPDVRVLVLSAGRDTPAAVARRLVELGYGASELVVLGDLGSPREARWVGRAQTWSAEVSSGLNVVGVHCRREGLSPRQRRDGAGEGPPALPGLPTGIPGTLVGAALVQLLDPGSGELLWEVGGTGLLGRACRGRQHVRVESLTRDDLAEVGDRPDAVLLVCDAATVETVEFVRRALAPGGRLVAAAVSLRDAAALVRLHGDLGGELVRIGLGMAGVPAAASQGAAGPGWLAAPDVVAWRWEAPTATPEARDG